MYKNSTILLFKQGMMQARHDMILKYKNHNLCWQDEGVVPFGPFLAVSLMLFHQKNLYRFILNNLLKNFANHVF
jgi:hypothetical protein